ncbi:hypothetical protein [Listeria marthii]|uniref:hypothetical protein n=1 Tax=Listeria marthii TaxID=529731 RepID=UPI001629F7DB|nr:hypothetical protein [Listeria marthii]MBC2122196.1 hypothetical protein [Listeria marthii]MBC2128562.1 hypothetical protein [Listeria marthii]
MSRIDIGEIQTFAYQLYTANEAGRKNMQDIKNAAKNYTEDGSKQHILQESLLIA